LTFQHLTHFMQNKGFPNSCWTCIEHVLALRYRFENPPLFRRAIVERKVVWDLAFPGIAFEAKVCQLFFVITKCRGRLVFCQIDDFQIWWEPGFLVRLAYRIVMRPFVRIWLAWSSGWPRGRFIDVEFRCTVIILLINVDWSHSSGTALRYVNRLGSWISEGIWIRRRIVLLFFFLGCFHLAIVLGHQHESIEITLCVGFGLEAFVFRARITFHRCFSFRPKEVREIEPERQYQEWNMPVALPTATA